MCLLHFSLYHWNYQSTDSGISLNIFIYLRNILQYNTDINATLGKPGRTIKNEQSRDTEIIGYTRHRTKTNTTQHKNENIEQHGPHQNQLVNPDAREW